MVPVYNDEDIIQEVIEHLISQGMELVVLDNGSTDKSYEICKKFLGKGILTLQQFKSDTYRSEVNHRILYDMALTHSPDWVIRSDSDELLESGQQGSTLKEAIEKVDATGHNLIQFNRFDFFMTDDDNESVNSFKEKMKYYSYQGDFLYRAWKYFPGIRIGDAAGHYPVFPDGYRYKISPNKFVLRHYTFRSQEQAEKKMSDRVRGTGTRKENKRIMNNHYKLTLKQNYSDKIDHKKLTKYLEDDNWDHEIKLCLFAWKNPPKREDIFSDDGELKIKQKTPLEYRIELTEVEIKLRDLHTIRGYFNLGKKFVIRKLRRPLGLKTHDL